MAAEGEYPLHESVFHGDLKRVSKLLRIEDVTKKDIHGKFFLCTVGFDPGCHRSLSADRNCPESICARNETFDDSK